jgi:hypothetical protein
LTRICPNAACPDRVSLDLAGEYVDSVEVCPHCGTRLVEGPRSEPETRAFEERIPDLDMVCVLRTADEALAALAKSMLESENIAYVVRGEALQDLLGWGRIGGFNYLVGPAEVVHAADADRARALLQTGGVVIDPLEPEGDA